MKTRFRKSAAAVVATLALALSACSGGASSGDKDSIESVPVADYNKTAYEDIKQGGDFVTATTEFPDEQNVYHANATMDTRRTWMWFNPVVSTYTPEGEWEANPDYITNVVEEVVDGKTHLTLDLNEKAEFNDGTPIDWRSFEAVWKINRAAEGVYQPNSTDGYQDIESVSQGENAKQVKIVFDKVYPWWQSIIDLTHPDIVEPSNYADYKKTVHPERGAGPFKVETFDFAKGEAIFVPNEKWWGKPAKLDRRIVRKMDSMAALNAFKNGEIDTTGAHLRERYAAVQSVPGIEIKKGRNPAVSLDTLNADSKILSDVRVREAYANAMDRKQMTEIWYQGLPYTQEPVGSFALYPFQPGYEDSYGKVASFDPEKAKSLLDEAGWTPGADGIREKDGQRLELRYLSIGESTTGDALATAQQKMAKDVGIDLKIEKRPSSDFSKIVNTKDFDILPMQFTSNSPDGVAYFGQVYASDSGLNRSGTGTPELDEKIKKLQSLPTREEQTKYAFEIEPEALSMFGLIPYMSNAAISAQKEGLANVGTTAYHTVYPELVGWKK